MPPNKGNTADHVATLRGAGIAALGAIVAASIGLGAAWITANLEDDRTRGDFIRTQRQAAYAEYLATASEVTDLVELHGSDATLEEAEAVVAAMNDMHAQLQELALLARAPTHIMASALYIRLRAHATHEVYAPFCGANPGVDTTACDILESAGGTAPVPEDAFATAHDDFIREARNDLQVEDWGE